MSRSPKSPFIAAGFAARLNAIMEEKGLYQSQVAAKIWDREVNSEGKNVAKGRDRLSRWCNAKELPTPENLVLLAKALGVEPTDLLPDAEPQARQSSPVASLVVCTDGQALLNIINHKLPLETALAIMKLLGTQ